MKTQSYALLHSPDNGSTASVQLNSPLGLLYIQALDAYGFQRELSVTLNTDEVTQAFGTHLLKVYQHPGRRDSMYLSTKEADTFIERIEQFCREDNLRALLFNVPEPKGRARCNGLVHLCEAIHAGRTFREIARDNL